MNSIRLVVRNPDGIHLRPLAFFVQTAGRFKAAKPTIRNVTMGSKAVSATSALLLTSVVKAKQGHEIEVTADGPDEEAALVAIREAVESGLGEQIG